MIDYISRSVNVEAIRRTFIVHGEPQAQEAYKDHLYAAGFREISIPEKGSIVEL